ncbi:MAG: ABC transporter ATP-binding protein [Acidimicrobiia bacterium]
MIRLDHVSKVFPGSEKPAVGDLSFEIPAGEIVVLVGPSGCGKTTTLKMINRLIEPTSGEIWIDGVKASAEDPHLLRRKIGYVIQQVGLFPHRTIVQNIATVPSLLGWERERIEPRVSQLIELVGLEPEVGDRYPAELSGGQQQRVGVARALAADPPVLLMDEPFGAVDPIVRARLQDELKLLQARLQKTIVFVTHDIDEAISLGDRVALLNVGGVLEQYAPPEEILRAPANDFVVEFLGSERGLRRLSLISVDTIELEQGPVVTPETTPEQARAVMDTHDVDWVGIVDDGRLLGWVWGAELAHHATVGELEPRPFSAKLSGDSTLRQVLNAIVTSKTQMAVIVDGDRYRGMLSAERLNEALLS